MIPSITAKQTRVITVPLHAAGLRADRFLLTHLGIPPSLLFKLLRVGSITLENKKRLNQAHRLEPQSKIHIPNHLVTAIDKQHPKMGKNKTVVVLPTLLETEALSVFQKPRGLACQGGSKVTLAVDTVLRQMDSSEATGYRLVHRLDRMTTGALVVARSRLAASALAMAFRDRRVEKRYVAVLQGVPHKPHGTIDYPLLNTGTKVVLDKNGKQAITRYRVLGTLGGNCAVVELDILTGRKHQIRAHCSGVLGCPLLGDTKYSTQANDTMYLHLHKICVPNVDISGNTVGKLTVRAPFPKFWASVLSALDIHKKLDQEKSL
ncbi:hypothetical protein GGI26_003104 [Coemansia sp. RSA 1358]|uniref:Pseudouridine synthase RsuA/RluA-like domain-containing protein n=1 Tax=Coemansia umbellata TaxID=1424467 RepID=A0ABQ8PDG4_9FUNG|nr:hypothetical protein EDC05_006253 [Coemansia umbellata]KAJ2622658.1 hypothetical protein GGI26_003104 [Coemansia sp. RSA 1358]